MNRYAVLKQIRSKKADAKKILDACESRDMTEDEKAKFDGLMVEVKGLNEKLEKLALVDDDGADEPEDDRRSAPVAPPTRKSGNFEERTAPAVHGSDAKDRPYSILRAMQCQLEGRRLDGIEGEISQELARRSERSPQGFLVPLGNEPEFRHIRGVGRPYGETRTDLTTTTGTGAVFVSPELPFIELLRNKMVLKQLGARFMTGMSGKFSIPRQTGAATASWIAESASVTATAQSIDNVAFVDKTLAVATNMTRKFIYQSSLDAESFAREDLSTVIAIALDQAALNGSGSGATPLGVGQNSTIITNSAGIQGGTNGLAPTFVQMVAAETQVANANADRGSLKYLTTPAARGKLKGTVKVSNYPVYIWQDDEINGYPAIATNQLPSNLTKGTSSGVCSMLIFGNWEDLIVAQWGGIDVVVNPYTGQLAGNVQVSMMLEADAQVRHPESFAVISDLLTT